MNEKQVVLAFWAAMNSNDFYKASELLTADFQCYWPQSQEWILGRHNFAAINSNYPARGKWRFTINSIVHEGSHVVTDVDVTDGHVEAKAITFYEVAHGLIQRQIEYWPDAYDAPEWRRAWVKLEA